LNLQRSYFEILRKSSAHSETGSRIHRGCPFGGHSKHLRDAPFKKINRNISRFPTDRLASDLLRFSELHFRMKPLSARIVIAAALGLASNTCVSIARTCSLENFGCLFELAKPRFEPPIIAFSFLPLLDRLAFSPLHRPAPTAPPEPPAPEQTDSPTEFTSRFMDPQQPLGTEPVADPTDAWPLMQVLRPLRTNPHVDGFSHNLNGVNSFVALDYSDIFETGRAPYKGGHGVSLFFRHDF